MTKSAHRYIHAVDLDGTLAYYSTYISPTHIGDPIPLMRERVEYWLRRGERVVIFTARADPNDPNAPEAIAAIKAWCKKHFNIEFEVTAIKTKEMHDFWDDRAHRVVKNKGLINE